MKSLLAAGPSLSAGSAGSKLAPSSTMTRPALPDGATRLRSLFTGAVRRIGPGGRVFEPGEPARNLFFVVHGLVKLTDMSPAGDEVIVHLYRPGEIFGERCFSGGAQQFFATAFETSEVLETPASGVIDQIRSRPDTLVELLGELSGRLTAIEGEFQSFVSDSVLVRLGAKLLALASASERDSDWLDLPRGLSHETFAQMLGVHRETVTREIASLRKLGIVATAGRRPIRIHGHAMRRFLRSGHTAVNAWSLAQ
jgi:CRP/FNR family transcriptional regulator, cyclic AMP receptor protein